MSSLFIDWASQPLGMVCLLLLVTLALLWWPGQASPVTRIPATTATVLLWLAASPIPANALLARIEIDRTGPTDCGSWPMVVPGGGMDAWRRSDNAYELLHEDTLRRVQRAADLANDDTRFHVLGGGSNGRTLADLMARVLNDRGVPDARIVRERKSRSTRENARELLGPLPPDSVPGIHLVTSALHLARATRRFEEAGYVVCGTGVASIAAPSAGLVGWLPWLSALERSSAAWRETLATFAARLR